MGTVISILIVIVCVLLVLVVLIQNSKGGGLASSFSSSNQVMGVRKTADFLEKATWTLAIALLALCLVSTAFTKTPEGATTTTESVTKKKADEGSISTGAPAKTNAPAAPMTIPAAPPAGGAPLKK